MRFQLKIFVLLVALIPIALGWAWAGSPVPPKAGGASALQGPKAVFSEIQYKFDDLFEGEDIKHDFVVENQGDAPLVIKNIRPG